MKLKLFVFVLFILSLSTNMSAQNNAEEKIKSEKIAFFTNIIGLTAKEAQVFWPVYNEYWNKKNTILNKRRKKMSFFMENSDKMNNDEMIQYADQYIQFEIELSGLLEGYHKKFKAILPIEKVMRIYLADYEFKSYLLKKIQEKGSN
ncbi:MAG: hypothetical protein MI739_13370 [Bacteroidales bacterium]|nr:hypothetical protein [Bacteroidales bacterium]